MSLAARPQASPTAAPPTRALGLSRTLSTNGYFPAVGGLAGSNFVDRMRSASQFSVYGLVPPLVMSAIKRYGLYHSSPTVPHQSEGWYCNGWSMFSGIPHSASTPLESEAGCSSDGNDDPAESDVISRSCSDVRFLSPAKAGDRTPSRPGKRRVALFGGSFSPIAVHHLEIAAELVNTNEADEVRGKCIIWYFVMYWYVNAVR